MEPSQAATALDAAFLLHDGLRARRDDGFGRTIARLLDQPLIPSKLPAD
jgi:hypothetical protein